MKNKNNEVIFFVLIFLMLFVGTFSLVTVRAEDDSEVTSDDIESRKIAQTTSVSKSVDTIILKDSDGDGILDKDDKHPNMAEIYIVEDNNKNGIVDKFEK
jgi:uncharacterized membrane protein